MGHRGLHLPGGDGHHARSHHLLPALLQHHRREHQRPLVSLLQEGSRHQGEPPARGRRRRQSDPRQVSQRDALAHARQEHLPQAERRRRHQRQHGTQRPLRHRVPDGRHARHARVGLIDCYSESPARPALLLHPLCVLLIIRIIVVRSFCDVDLVIFVDSVAALFVVSEP